MASEEAVDKTRTDSQRESLGKEYESYKQKKPWRELQNVEKEKEDSKAESDSKDKDEDKDEDEKGGL